MSSTISSSPFVRGIPVIGPWLDTALFGPPMVRDSTPGGMALIFGLSPHHPEYKKGVLGKFRSSSAGRLVNAIFLILTYIFILTGPAIAMYRASAVHNGSGGVAGVTAGAHGVECKRSFPLQCEPADTCRMRGLQCVPRD